MVKFVVEDGSMPANAVSYCTVKFADDYFDIRGEFKWLGLSTEQKQESLVRATTFLDNEYRNRFIGDILYYSQSLQWPRDDVIIGEFILPRSHIPTELKNCICELAMYEITYSFYTKNVIDVVNTITPLSTSDVKLTTKKVDSLEQTTEYFGSKSSSALSALSTTHQKADEIYKALRWVSALIHNRNNTRITRG